MARLVFETQQQNENLCCGVPNTQMQNRSIYLAFHAVPYNDVCLHKAWKQFLKVM